MTGTTARDSTPAEAPFGTVTLRVRYFAGARDAAGVPEETLRLAAPEHGVVTVGEALAAALSAHGGRLERVIAASSFLLDGTAVRDRGLAVSDGSQLDVLPPFAGG